MNGLKIIKTVLSGEFLFALFLFAGYFKSVLTFVPVDLTVLLMIITFLIAMKRLYEGHRVYIKPIILWLLFIIFAAASLLYTHESAMMTGVAIDKFLRLAVISTWCFVAPFLLFRDKESVRKFVWGVIGLGIVMGAASFFPSQNQAGFVEVFGSNYQALSRIAGSTSLVFLGVFLFSKTSFKVRFVSLLASLLLIIPMLVSGGRLTAVIYLVIAVGIFPIMFFEVNIRKKTYIVYKRVYAYAITLLAIVSATFIILKLGYLDTFIFRVKVMFEDSGGGESIIGRTNRMAEGVEMIYANPIFGHGLGSFGFHFMTGLLDDTPHHIFIEIWSELGIIPLIIFSIIFVQGSISAYKIWRLQKNDWVLASIFILSVFWFVAALISSGLTSGKILFAFLGVSIAVYYSLSTKKENQTSQ